MKLSQAGLTTTYDCFHDLQKASTDIKKLRELHVEMKREFDPFTPEATNYADSKAIAGAADYVAGFGVYYRKAEYGVPSRKPKNSCLISSSVGRRVTAFRLWDLRVRVLANPFSGTLSRQSLLHPALLSRLQVKGVALHVFDDLFRLHLALESPQGTLDGLTVL